MRIASAQHRPRPVQFSLAALLEYTTICAVILSLSHIVGIATSCFLMAMGLALGASQGLLALAMFMAASLAADMPLSSMPGDRSMLRQEMVILLAGLLCSWYLLRRKVSRAGLQVPRGNPQG